MLDALAHYAETNCKDDMTIFLSSGFEAKSTTRSAPAPTATPGIVKVDQGKTGEAVVKINPVLNARSYEIRSGALGSGALSLFVAAVFVFLSVVFRWPMFFALIPIALTGPFMVSVITARRPHCQRPLYRNF